MTTIKKLKNQDKQNYLKYTINGEPYRAYEIGKLPAKFGCLRFNNSDGVDTWFTSSQLGSGHAGLTFISEDYFPKWG